MRSYNCHGLGLGFSSNFFLEVKILSNFFLLDTHGRLFHKEPVKHTPQSKGIIVAAKAHLYTPHCQMHTPSQNSALSTPPSVFDPHPEVYFKAHRKNAFENLALTFRSYDLSINWWCITPPTTLNRCTHTCILLIFTI